MVSCAVRLWLYPGACLLPSDEIYLAVLHEVGAKFLAAGVAEEDWAGALVGAIELRSTGISS